MKTADERAEAVERRAKEIQRTSTRRRARAAQALCLCACAAALIGVVSGMPSAGSSIDTSTFQQAGVASVFSQGQELGYVVTAVIAFILGVGATVVCLALQRKIRQNGEDDDD